MLSWITIGLTGLWPLVWKFGVSGLVCAGLVAAYFLMPAPVAVMFPNLRKWLLPAAGCVALSIVSYAVGVADDHNRNVAQEIRATETPYADARQAAADAPLQVKKRNAAAGRKPSVWVRAPGRDEYDIGKKR